ncbi:MAG: AGE family epimerase/isomerase, partial [Oscillospiraceae bacterium]
KRKIWWVQAETVVGFLNAYQKSGDGAFLSAARAVWDYIQTHIIDRRTGGEWFYRLSADGTPDPTQETAGPWKCPYHNGRMCLEVIKRGVE